MIKGSHIFKTAAALLLTGALAGCFDVDMQITVVDSETASAKITTTVPKDLVSLADIESGDAEFCDSASEITETEDSITCVETHEGKFDEVIPQDSSSEEPQPTIALVAPGQVKVSFPTGTLSEEMGAGAGDDEESAQAMQMMKTMFAGHGITMRVVGNKIIDTNMTLSADGKSAELKVMFTDLIEGTLQLPEESYAVVQLP